MVLKITSYGCITVCCYPFLLHLHLENHTHLVSSPSSEETAYSLQPIRPSCASCWRSDTSSLVHYLQEPSEQQEITYKTKCVIKWVVGQDFSLGVWPRQNRPPQSTINVTPITFTACTHRFYYGFSLSLRSVHGI